MGIGKRKPPEREDQPTAARWRGLLFCDFTSPIMWKDEYYRMLEPPRSVTFPICAFCDRVIWDWPHFEEPVPVNAVCEVCFKEEEEANRRDMER
jgi:hypothetical protein